MPDMDTGMERRHTDRGQTGDKIAVSDPAAVPVHADAEAAGTPTPRAAVMASVAALMENSLRAPRPDAFGAWRQPHATGQRRLGRVAGFWLVVVPVALGLLAGWISWPS